MLANPKIEQTRPQPSVMRSRHMYALEMEKLHLGVTSIVHCSNSFNGSAAHMIQRNEKINVELQRLVNCSGCLYFEADLCVLSPTRVGEWFDWLTSLGSIYMLSLAALFPCQGLRLCFTEQKHGFC